MNSDMASAKREALSACSKVESMGSAMASMPHYMSKGVNELAASGVEKAVNGLMSMLLLVITGVEEVIIFFINVMTQTYLCLITFVISGSLHAALDIIKAVTDFLDDTLGKIGDELSDGAKAFQDSLNGFISGINGIASVFGNDKGVPEIDISKQIDELKDLKLPDSLDEDLKKLNDSIPTFDEVNNFTNNALRMPFEIVKNLVNESLDEFTFDRSILPVPAKEKMSFCSDSDGINGFFGKIASLISTGKTIFLATLIIGAVAACIPMAYREIRAWRSMKDRSTLVGKNAHDPLDVVYIVSRPHTSTVGLKIASWFKNERRQVLVRWVVAYATSPPALFVLSLGIAGLFSCACQMALLSAVKKEVPGLSDQVGEFAGKVVDSLNNASEQWAVSTNHAIGEANNDINDKVFGWVNTTTGGVNDTLNVFVDETNKVLNTTFGGTILYDPIKEVLNCLIMLKIKGIQKALTWVSDHAHVDFPQMANDTFSLGALESMTKGDDKGDSDSDNFLSNPEDTTTDAITSAVKRVTDSIQSGIRTEALISTCIVAIWVFIVLLALIRALVLSFRRDKLRGNGGGDPAFYNSATLSRDIDGFQDVQLESTSVPNNNGISTYSTKPHAQQSQARTAHVDDSEMDYQDQKLGFAGQRDYESALKNNGTYPAHTSSYGQVEYGINEKR